MKRYWIEYCDQWQQSPMTYWVHFAPPNELTDSRPPAPHPVAGKGYPVYFVEYGRFTFKFASLDELEVCIETLGQKLMPNTRRMAAESGGLNSHWLSRLPDHVKPWRYRSKAVEYLKIAYNEFWHEVGSTASARNFDKV